MSIKYVNIGDKKVKAIMDDCKSKLSLKEKIENQFKNEYPELAREHHFINFLSNTYKATSSCHEDDTFDYEKGKELAKLYVLRRFYGDGMAAARTLAEGYKRKAEIAEEFLKNYEKRVDELDSDINGYK